MGVPKNYQSYPILLLFLLSLIYSIVADDITALRHLTTLGGHTREWNFSDPTPCSWHGIYCNNNGSVIELRLPGAGLLGEIPILSLGNLTNLRILSLRSNSLSGPLPSNLPSQLKHIFLQDNSFSGEIPISIFSLTSLSRLVLSENKISGNISPDFNKLGNLRILYLQNNNFSGSIPRLDSLTSLEKFNVSNNNLNGSIPSVLQKFNSDSFVNTSLCGSPLSPCPSDKKDSSNNLSSGARAGIIVGSIIGLLLILILLFIFFRRRGNTEPHVVSTPRVQSPVPVLETVSKQNLERAYSEKLRSSLHDGMVIFEKGALGFTFEELLRASAEVLGKGMLGSSYRAYLPGGVTVVVKRLRDVCVGESEFREMVEGLGRLRHENLVGVRGYYYGKEEKLVVYESMPMGSLAALLHENREADVASFTWEMRTKIAYGAACGISYLHSLGPASSHGNIKSSNILLTDTYSPSVSEFFLNQLVSSTSSTLSIDTYCPPEVTDTRNVSQKADVYSFGVVLLELVTGKIAEGGSNLPEWIKGAVVFDKELVGKYNLKTEDMVRVLELGVECTSIHPDHRPMMSEVTNRLKEVARWR